MSNRHKLLKGSSILLLAVATGCANPGGAKMPDATAGIANMTAGAGLVSNNAGGLISNNAGGLISNNAGGLISNNAGGLISNNAGGLSGIVKGPAAGLISNNAGGLISNNAGGLISNNAGGLISNNAGGLISNNAGGYHVTGVDESSAPLAGARVAVYNERGEQISYAWTTTNDKGEYTFKRLKPSGPLLFVKAVIELEGQQITLMSVAPAPREAGIKTIDVDPATTFVAKKMKEMTVKRAVSVVSVKPDAIEQIVAKLAPVMSDKAIVAAVIFPEEKAAETFDFMLADSNNGAALTELLGATLASAGAPPALISETPSQALPPGAITDDVVSGGDPSDVLTDPSDIGAVNPGQTNTSGDDNLADPSLPDPGDSGDGGTDTTTAPAITSTSVLLGTAGANLRYGSLAASGSALGVATGSSLQTATASSLGASSLTLSTNAGVSAKAVAYGDDGKLYALTSNGIVVDGNTTTFSTGISGTDLAVHAGTAYVVSATANKVYAVNLADGAVSTLAGGGAGNKDGAGSDAMFQGPSGIAYFGNALYVADASNHAIRKIDVGTGLVSTLAGGKGFGGSDGTGSLAKFQNPTDVTVDSAGNVYVSDQYNSKIRKIDPDGAVTTLSDKLGGYPYSIAYGSIAGTEVLFYDNGTEIKVLKGW